MAVEYQGAWTCSPSGLPRYVANANGTVTDNQTGLMWEMKTGTVGTLNPSDVHDVNNISYSWTSTSGYTGTAADGTLFTQFLATLNGGDYYNPADMLDENAGPGTCFANHCDWRIPTIAELGSIIETGPTCGTGAPCIDATFGPTGANYYWSSSSVAGTPVFVWIVFFFNGNVLGNAYKSGGHPARAVRGGR